MILRFWGETTENDPELDPNNLITLFVSVKGSRKANENVHRYTFSDALKFSKKTTLTKLSWPYYLGSLHAINTFTQVDSDTPFYRCCIQGFLTDALVESFPASS